MQRRTKNIGAYAGLEVPMQVRAVKALANKHGISLKGITLRIVRNRAFVGTGYTGNIETDNPDRINLYPDSFASEEELLRTMLHENEHRRQVIEFGSGYMVEHVEEMEAMAREAEKQWRKR